jgi:two-component system, chemotaxis family, response regulator PixG
MGSDTDMPINLLEQAVKEGSGCLRLYDGNVHWLFYIVYGKIAYATNSIDCFERLDRQLKRLRHEVPSLPKNIGSELRLNFESDFPNFEDKDIALVPDYQAICAIATENYLEPVYIEKLVARQTQEVLEMFFALSNIREHPYRIDPLILSKVFCNLKLENVATFIGRRLSAWQAMAPAIKSPYEIPYIASEAVASRYISPDAVKKLHKMLRGFNFRQLGALHNQDELAIAKKLHPLIRDGAIWMRAPTSPFDFLPLTSHGITTQNNQEKATEPVDDNQIASFTQIIAAEHAKKKIVCIDDSQSMLNEIERLLEGNDFTIHTINDSVKAMMKMSSIKPDLILLDVGMPNVDGYQLCTLIRKTSMLKEIPVVMVTGNKGLIDRAKAKIAGATDFLPKPFTQEDLLKMAFRYLT